MDNLDGMDKFLLTVSLPKLNQEESDNLNGQIIPSEIEAVIKKFPTSQSLGPDGLTGEFYIQSQTDTISSQTIPRYSKRENHKVILQGQHYPYSNTI